MPPAAYFFQERKKYAKTPFETNGFKTATRCALACIPPAKNPSPAARIFGVSRIPLHGKPLSFPNLLPRAIGVRDPPLNVAWPCASPPLVRLPIQNVEAEAPTFQSGAAAKREAGTISYLHQKRFTSHSARQGVLLTKKYGVQGGQGTIGPLRRFFSEFSALSQKRERWRDGFLADGAHPASAASRTFAGGKKRGRRRQTTRRPQNRIFSPSITRRRISASSPEVSFLGSLPVTAALRRPFSAARLAPAAALRAVCCAVWWAA